MTNSSPFNQDNGNTINNPFADQLGAIVNEKGEPKYKTVEDALQALVHSQQFIDTLKNEKREIESKFLQVNAELEKRASVEEVVERLTKQKVEGTPKAIDQSAPAGSVDENTIRNLIENTLQTKTAKENEEKNLSEVVSTLQQEYGDKLTTVISERARELNTTTTELEKLAKTNPKMALSLLSNRQVVSNNPSTTSLVSKFTPKQPELPKMDRKIMQTGVSNQELGEIWRKVREHTHQKLGVTE